MMLLFLIYNLTPLDLSQAHVDSIRNIIFNTFFRTKILKGGGAK